MAKCDYLISEGLSNGREIGLTINNYQGSKLPLTMGLLDPIINVEQSETIFLTYTFIYSIILRAT